MIYGYAPQNEPATTEKTGLWLPSSREYTIKSVRTSETNGKINQNWTWISYQAMNPTSFPLKRPSEVGEPSNARWTRFPRH